MLDHPRHRAAVQRPERIVPHQGGDHARVRAAVLRGAVDHVVEVDRHLEQFGEFRIALAEHIVDAAIAEQHHLDAQRYGFGLQRNRGRHATGFHHPLDAHFARLQGPLQRIPGVGIGQHLLRVEQQIAAVGAQQRARLDQVEVGDQRAELGDVLDTADQVGLCRVVLVDHRRRLRVAVVDHHVDLIAPERRRPRRPAPNRHLDRRLGTAFLVAEEIVRVLDHVLADLIEVGDDLGRLGVARAQFLDHVADDERGHLAIELAQILAVRALPLRRLAHDRLHLLLELGDIGLGFLLLGLGQLVELIGIEHFAVPHRRQRESRRGPDHGDMAFPRALLDLLQGLFVAFLVLRLQRLVARTVFIGLEGGRDRFAQVGDQPLHVAAQRHSLARRQPDGARLVRFGEIVDVDPVRGQRLGGGGRLEMAPHHGVLAGAGRAQRIHVVAVAANADAEAHRLDRAVLAQAVLDPGQLVGGAEVELFGIARAVQPVRGKGFWRCHVSLYLGVRFRLDAFHIPIRQAEMVADLVDQHVPDQMFQIFAAFTPVIQ